MFVLLAILLALGAAQAQENGSVTGVVVDFRGGEPLTRVGVKLSDTGFSTVTDDKGRFALEGVPPGDYTLHVATVGYRLLKQPFHLNAGETQDFEVVLSPDTFRQAESIEVRAGPFEPIHEESPSELTIEGNEIKNLASVLADDPLRAVQGMPGISSNDDFNAFFAIRGADYHRVGLYLDDVLLHLPFHMVVEDNPTGSLTAINGDMLESLSLHAGAYPARYGDRTAGVLDAHTRNGSRRGVLVRGTASMSNAGATAEGPLGKRGAWLASFRKSYLQYLLRSVSDDDTLAFGFVDGQGKLSYDLTDKHSVSLSVLSAYSDLDQTRRRQRMGLNSIMVADYYLTMANAAWRYTPTGNFFMTNRAAYIREFNNNQNRDYNDLNQGYYGEWVYNANSTWRWRENATLDFGWSVRRLRDDGYWNRYVLRPDSVLRVEEYAGRAFRTGGYAQQSWYAFAGRLRLSAGARWDRHETNGIQSVSPQASVAYHLAPRTQIRFGWGQYVQHPDLRFFYMGIGNRALLPERSTQYIASIEHAINLRTRVRAEFWDREDRDLLARPLSEPRLVSGVVVPPELDASIRNSVRGYSRGFEVFLQRRSANRLSGWISYAYGRTRMRDGDTGSRYVANRDQVHTFNLFGTYRIRPTINLSAKWIYGSNFPIPGYYRREGDRYYLSEDRNTLRVRAYHRLDLRLNKAFVYTRWKLTLYAEVINVYNRDNRRFDELRWFRASDGRARLNFYDMFPILPSAGVVFEFGK